MKKISLLGFITIFIVTSVMAQVPDGFKYQSIVRDANGEVLSDKAVSLKMTFHQNSATGTTIYEETFSPTTNEFGLTSLELGSGSVSSGNFAAIDWASNVIYLEVSLDPDGGSSYTSMGTSQLIAVPYAMHSRTADSLAGVDDRDVNNELNLTFQVNGSDLELTDAGGTLNVPLTDIRDSIWLQNGDTIYPNSSVGWMGLGTTSPQYPVDLISGMSNATRGAFRIQGTNQSNTPNNFYYTSFFDAIATNGSNAAVLGEAMGSSAGINYGAIGNAHNSTFSNQGGSFWANGGTGSDNYGAVLTSQGVTAGSNYGLYSRAFESSSLNLGVFGLANSLGTNNVGVDGEAYTTNTNTNYGVYGYAANASTNYAGYFQGDVTVTGDLNVTGAISKGSGTFKIDHPLDPENKYLVHSFVESEDMMNVYNGNVVTDANGIVTVKLPDYFEAVNKDFRYQLTVVGVFAQAIIKEKVKDNEFVIQTNQPNVEVSWQVTGIRADPYAVQNRIVPVIEKKDKGTYLHPTAYEKPETMSETYKNDAWRRERDKTEAPSPQPSKR